MRLVLSLSAGPLCVLTAGTFMALNVAQPIYALNCGDQIVANIQLDADITCTGDGLVAAGVGPYTIDLKGHKLTGSGTGTGILIVGDSITVRGPGEISGFATGVSTR